MGIHCDGRGLAAGRRALRRAAATVAFCSATAWGQLDLAPPELYSGGATGFDRGVTAADFDGDGSFDVATILYVRLNDGNGRLGPRIDLPRPGTHGVAAADFDGDEDVDLVHVSDTIFAVRTFSNDGAGAFTTSGSWTAGSGASVATGDVDGDGAVDVVSTEWDFDAYAARNLGDGSFDLPVRIRVLQRPRSIALADLDGDGDLDIITANDLSTWGLTVIHNLGAFTFSGPSGYAAGGNPWSVATGDFDLDGDIDVAVANAATFTGAPGVSLHLNTGRGGLAPAIHYPAGAQPMSIVAADMDADGDLDLAVANCNNCLEPFAPSDGESNVALLENDGSGAFKAPVFFPTGPAEAVVGGPRSVHACDLNGDELPDIVTADYTHDGAFTASWTLSTLLNQSPVACYADCDASGELDFFDFLCFQNAFVAAARYGDCDRSGAHDFFDFLCFQNAFAEGCL